MGEQPLQVVRSMASSERAFGRGAHDHAVLGRA